MFGSGNVGQNNWGGAVPLSHGLDTRRCKIIDPRLLPACLSLGLLSAAALTSGAARGMGGKFPPYGWTSKNYVICVCFHCHRNYS